MNNSEEFNKDNLQYRANKKRYTKHPKYLVQVDFSVSGLVQKNDVMGAFFKETKELLDHYDIQKLVFSKKSGYIDIEIIQDTVLKITKGTINLPLNLDKPTTAIIAAALTMVTMVGPFSCQSYVKSILDMSKDRYLKLKELAKEIMVSKFIVESDSNIEDLVESLKTEFSEIHRPITVTESVFAGPYYLTSRSLYLVEGFADVKKMMSLGLNNVISINGAKIDTSALQILKNKEEIIVLLDNDEGGRMILENLSKYLSDYSLVTLPDGCTVESVPRNVLWNCIKDKREIKNKV